jgi:pimeloyl-ACP methyl ester carboxylesterase
MHYEIDEKEQVLLGNVRQTIHIWSRDKDFPVLLFLHGGPGVPNRHSIAKNHLDLTDSFTVVAWDQRGTGGSYFDCDPKSLTLEQLICDGIELLQYLCQKLSKKKIYLIGGSWGTELGTFLCDRAPELVAGYIGYGQVVNGIENENLSYAYTLQKATEAQDEKSLQILKEIGPPKDGQYTPVFEGLMKQRRILSKYGGHTVKKESYFTGTVLPILLSAELSLKETYGTAKGYKICLSQMWPTIVRYDFLHDLHTFAMPYYIFQGRRDENTPASLIQDYYDAIAAPDKDLIWFEHSAHGPLGEEPELFKQRVREKFLKCERRQPS